MMKWSHGQSIEACSKITKNGRQTSSFNFKLSQSKGSGSHSARDHWRYPSTNYYRNTFIFTFTFPLYLTFDLSNWPSFFISPLHHGNHRPNNPRRVSPLNHSASLLLRRLRHAHRYLATRQISPRRRHGPQIEFAREAIETNAAISGGGDAGEARTGGWFGHGRESEYQG